MTYRVRMQRLAKRDVRTTTDWIAERSPDGADRWVDALNRALESLRSDPESYSLAEEYEEFPSQTLRQFFFKTRRGRKYRGLFTVVGNEVRVLRVRGPGQDLVTPDEVELDKT